MTQEALKELLEAVEAAIQAGDWKVDGACDPDSVIKRSKEALAEHAMSEVQRFGQEIEQEPVVTKDSGGRMTLHLGWDDLPDGTKLYATPPQPKQELVCVCGAVWDGQELMETPPQRKPLTEQKMFEAIRPIYSSDKAARLTVNHSKDEYRAIEAAHGIKENT